MLEFHIHSSSNKNFFLVIFENILDFDMVDVESLSIQSSDILTFSMEKFPYPYGRWETALNLGFQDGSVSVENVSGVIGCPMTLAVFGYILPQTKYLLYCLR